MPSNPINQPTVAVGQVFKPAGRFSTGLFALDNFDRIGDVDSAQRVSANPAASEYGRTNPSYHLRQNAMVDPDQFFENLCRTSLFGGHQLERRSLLERRNPSIHPLEGPFSGTEHLHRASSGGRDIRDVLERMLHAK